MINFLTKPSINDSWSVLLFDFQSDNPEFLSRWRQEKGENLFTKSIVPQQRLLLVSHSFIDFPQKQTQRRKMHLRPGKKTHKEPCAMNSNLWPLLTESTAPGTPGEKCNFTENLLIFYLSTPPIIEGRVYFRQLECKLLSWQVFRSAS